MKRVRPEIVAAASAKKTDRPKKRRRVDDDPNKFVIEPLPPMKRGEKPKEVPATPPLLPVKPRPPAPEPIKIEPEVVPVAVEPLDIAALQQKFTPNSTEILRAKYPALTRMFLDESVDEATGLRRHDYYLDGKRVWFKGCSGIADEFFPKFNSEAVSERNAADPTKNPLKLTPAQIRAEWAGTSEFGRRRHLGMEAFLLHKPLPKGAIEPPPAFYRMLAAHVHEWDIWGTEIIFYDEHHQIVGTADVVFISRLTGKLIICDYKNYGGQKTYIGPRLRVAMVKRHAQEIKLLKQDVHAIARLMYIHKQELDAFDLKEKTDPAVKHDLPDVHATYGPSVRFGTHALTRMQLASKFTKLSYQLNMERHMAEHVFGLEVEALYGFIFPPQYPDRCIEWQVPIEDMTSILRYFPRSVRPPLVIEEVTREEGELDPEEGGIDIMRGHPPPLQAHEVWINRAWKENPDSLWIDAAAPFQKSCTCEQLAEYELQLRCDEERIAHLMDLAGKTLLCWCKEPTDMCHADVLQRYGNAAGRGLLRYIAQ